MQPGGRGALPWPEDSDAATAATRSALAYPDDEWQRKGATLSDKTACQKFGLTQDEIYDAIDRARCSTARPTCTGTRG